MVAARITPANPNWFSTPVGSGMKGCQLSGFTKNAPTAMNARITVTLMPTMMLLTVADSDTPRIRRPVQASTMKTAGRLNSEVTTDEGSTGTTAASGSCTVDPEGTTIWVPTARSRRCVVAGSSTFTASWRTAWLSVLTATSSALISAKPPPLAWSTTSYCASAVLNAPEITALPWERNCTVLPSVSCAVTPFRLTSGSVMLNVDACATTILPTACVYSAGMLIP